MIFCYFEVPYYQRLLRRPDGIDLASSRCKTLTWYQIVCLTLPAHFAQDMRFYKYLHHVPMCQSTAPHLS